MDALLYALVGTAGIVVGAVGVYFNRLRSSSASKDRFGAVVGVAGLALAALSVVVGVLELRQDCDDDAKEATKGATVSSGDVGGDVCAPVNGDCNGLPKPEELAQLSIEEARERLRAVEGASDDPVGTGPWTYIVLGTNEQGLFIRDGYTIDDARLPGEPVVLDARPVYADCKISDGWQADTVAPNIEQQATWLKVRHPEPRDEGDFWVYGGYTFPIGHNGNIPECL